MARIKHIRLTNTKIGCRYGKFDLDANGEVEVSEEIAAAICDSGEFPNYVRVEGGSKKKKVEKEEKKEDEPKPKKSLVDGVKAAAKKRRVSKKR